MRFVYACVRQKDTFGKNRFIATTANAQTITINVSGTGRTAPVLIHGPAKKPMQQGDCRFRVGRVWRCTHAHRNEIVQRECIYFEDEHGKCKHQTADGICERGGDEKDTVDCD
jgi:hypothetical protein